MISVIVPVYNARLYLERCLDSLLNQGYKDLEILIIDDGSTDGSGTVCDGYAEKDERVRVFHTENRGLSAARNLGLDETKGEYIGFVDADDWIESDMFECLIKAAEQTGADIVECGVFLEYDGRTEEDKRQNSLMTGREAIHELIQQRLSNTVWNKIWKRRCFDRLRFPVGRVFEEIATTYRAFLRAELICSIAESKYHYLQHDGSLSRSHNMENLVGYWRSHRERYESLKDQVDEDDKHELLHLCAAAAARAWAYYCECPSMERAANRKVFEQMHSFTKDHYPLFGADGWGWMLRLGMVFPHFYSTISFRAAYLVNGMAKKIKAW